MRIYQTDTGVALDLDHLLAVGKVKEQRDQIDPYFFVLTLAFASKLTISADSAEEAEAEREKLLAAWQGAAVKPVRVVEQTSQPAAAAPAVQPQITPQMSPAFPAEDEVQQLIRAHEASLRSGGAAAAPGAAQPKSALDRADYSSPFI